MQLDVTKHILEDWKQNQIVMIASAAEDVEKGSHSGSSSERQQVEAGTEDRFNIS